jgi:hypothetical protein
MSHSVREELERLLQESLGLLRESDWDLGQLQQWSARREEIFARLRGAEFSLGAGERAATQSLIAEILKIDAKILARLEDQCCDLRQKINATDRLRRSYPGTSSHAPSLIQRAV